MVLAHMCGVCLCVRVSASVYACVSERECGVCVWYGIV